MMKELFLMLMNVCKKPSVVMLATKELEEAQKQLLQAQSSYEYAKRMADYHSDRIARLSAFLRNAHKV
jgi:hypothetical protein